MSNRLGGQITCGLTTVCGNGRIIRLLLVLSIDNADQYTVNKSRDY